MEHRRRVDEMRTFFNAKIGEYDSVHRQMMDIKEHIARALPDHTRRVLDLGVGTGLELFPLFERFPDARVTGADVSEAMLAELRKRPFADRIDVICGDFFTADLGSGYDAVISSAALHHFDEGEKLQLYGIVYGCLTSDGLFVNADRCTDTLQEQEALFEDYRINGHTVPHYDTPLWTETERRLLLAAGFRRVDITDIGGHGYRLIVANK